MMARTEEQARLMTPARTPSAAGSDAPLLTVQSHTWRSIHTVALNDLYDLAPGQYDIVIGPQTLLGDAVAANPPAKGWPVTEGSVAVFSMFIKVVP
jgi:hypothetical protein